MDHAVVRGNGPSSPDQAVVQSLMVTFSVVMGHEFSYRATKRRLTVANSYSDWNRCVKQTATMLLPSILAKSSTGGRWG